MITPIRELPGLCLAHAHNNVKKDCSVEISLYNTFRGSRTCSSKDHALFVVHVVISIQKHIHFSSYYTMSKWTSLNLHFAYKTLRSGPVSLSWRYHSVNVLREEIKRCFDCSISVQMSQVMRNNNKKIVPLRAMKTFIRKKMGQTT